MAQKFISFHSMIRGSGKTAYVVRTAKALSEKNHKVLLIDGYTHEVGGLLHRVADILGSVPELAYGCNLYDIMRDHELLLSVDREAKKKDVEKTVNKLTRSDVVIYKGHIVPEIVDRVCHIPGYDRIDFLPGTDSGNMDIKPAIDFKHLYENQQGCNFFDFLKDSLKNRYDFILIDAPVGFYTISGILCGHLADLFLAVDVDSPAYEGRPSYEVGLRLAEQVTRADQHPIRVESVKGQEAGYLVDLILENITSNL